ncbi:MAG TPA: hypothetical protein DCR97_14375 [Deltaproteobacteria bacterium]|nr:hypothetical protein [Deltaproteobacteria bacterium]
MAALSFRRRRGLYLGPQIGVAYTTIKFEEQGTHLLFLLEATLGFRYEGLFVENGFRHYSKAATASPKSFGSFQYHCGRTVFLIPRVSLGGRATAINLLFCPQRFDNHRSLHGGPLLVELRWAFEEQHLHGNLAQRRDFFGQKLNPSRSRVCQFLRGVSNR